MMFFNFQRFFAGFGSVLDPILEKEDCTLEKILDEETLAEIKNSGAQKFGTLQNYNLYESVTTNIQTFAKLIGYLNVNEDEGDAKTQIRYPFMISEAVGNENGPIIDYLFEIDKALPDYEVLEEQRKLFLPMIFNILDRDYLNVTLAGYFGKVVGAIIRRRGLDLWQFLSQPENKPILSNIVKNLDVFHIAEVVERLVILDTQQEHQENQKFYLEERNDLLKRVIRYLEYKTHQSDVVDNCCHILVEVLNKSEAFLPQLNQPEKFFTIALNSGFASVISVLITLLEAIYRYINQQQEKNPQFEFSFSQFFPIGAEFKSALAAEKLFISAFDTTYGDIQSPFSQMKLRLLQLYLTILRINNQELILSFDNQGIYSLLMEYLLKYEFNNQFQNLFYDITVLIFDKLEYVQEQINSLNLAGFIIKYNKVEKQQVGKMSKFIRRGYVGILSKLSYYFMNRIEHNQEWDEYIETELGEVRKVENEFMLGINPKPQKVQQDDDGMKDILSKIPIRFQQQPQSQNLEENNQQTVEIEVEDEDPDLDIEDDHDDEETNQIELQHESKKPPLLDVEEIDKVIKSPETSPKDVEQIIQFQEQSFMKQPQASEILTDQTVNTYWKTHEGQEFGRKSSSEDIHHHKHQHELSQEQHLEQHHEQHQEQHHEQHHEQHEEVQIPEQHPPEEKQVESVEVQAEPTEIQVVPQEQNVQVQDIKVEEINSPEEQQQQQDPELLPS